MREKKVEEITEEKSEIKSVYDEVRKFHKKYPMSIMWRVRKHCKIIERHLNADEKLLYVFAAQKNNNPLDVFSTYVIALTNKRLVLGRKRLVFGYFFDSITPEMFNDLNVMANLLWGKIHIDTINEYVTLSNIDKKALPEIETNITSYMIREKRRLGIAGKPKGSD